jgi:hypothetical protein
VEEAAMKTTYHNITDEEWDAGEWEGEDMSPLDYWVEVNPHLAMRDNFFSRFITDIDFYEGTQQ